MSQPEIVVQAALTIGGPSVYRDIRGDVKKGSVLKVEMAILDRQSKGKAVNE